jgi:LL-diaminopimelate aminotransferase
MKIEYSENLRKIPPYPFAEISKKKKAMLAKGIHLVDLGIGDPDLPTPQGIIDAMTRAVKDPATHRYPMDAGRLDFREAWAKWCRKRFGIRIEANQVQALMGSKEGLCNLARAFVNPGDRVLVPDPGYPGYANGATLLSGGVPVRMPLLEENSYLPDFDKINRSDAKDAKLMYLNYPNNPTGAVADKDFYGAAVDFCDDNDIILVSDNPYSEITYDGYVAPSVFEVSGAMDVAIELHSFSKTYNMTGWRLGVAYGNPEIVAGLSKVKENIDSGVFEAIQLAGIYALEQYDRAPAIVEYEKRMAVMVDAFNKIDIEMKKPKGTFYLWAEVPRGETSTSFVDEVLEKAHVVLTPGTAFGEYGEGYFRASITSSTERIKEAAKSIEKLSRG